MAKKSPMFWHLTVSREGAAVLTNAWRAAFENAPCEACGGVCCETCAAHGGYLSDVVEDPSVIDGLKAKHGWDDITGFRGAAGCRLPLADRAPTCVVYFCGEHDPTAFGDPAVAAATTQKTVSLRMLINQVAQENLTWYER